MKIVIDENISYAEEAFNSFGNLKLLPGRSIKNEDLRDTEILIVRSVTEVDEKLLSGSNVKFVGTATIGMDHLDEEYLKSKKIRYVGAAGCNAFAVSEYVLSAIYHLSHFNSIELKGKSIGIIGRGNIGSKVADYARALGLEVFVNDPPLERTELSEKFYSLEEALAADIVTFHVPLNLEGRDKTFHLLDEENIELIKPGAILVNSSRGPVIDNSALLNRLESKNDLFTVLDVWENEPQINSDLLKLVAIATPHVAGYTLEGKVNGTKIIYDALCEFLGEESQWEPKLPPIESNDISVDPEENINKTLYSILSKVYPIGEDSIKLKRASLLSEHQIPVVFDRLRKEYPLRRELDKYKVIPANPNSDLKNILRALRLSI